MQQEFSRDVRLAVRAADAWRTLLDFPRVASWLPIVHSLNELEPMRRYATVLEDKVGPFALRADLRVDVEADDAARRLRVSAAGEDRQVASRITAALDVTVTEDGDGSVLAASGRYEITGKMATLGASAIRKKGEHVLDQFFANASREVAGAG